MALAMRSAERGEVGRNPRELKTLVVALIRRGKVVPLAGDAPVMIDTGDLLVYIRNVDSSSAGVAV
jgi:voltage-gated potassium channel